ncbi:porin [Salmonella enterica subsp. enterica serovar Uzaramo]|nr:porin [Salmonella enterica subsp. enterica serovar Uzaramo]
MKKITLSLLIATLFYTGYSGAAVLYNQDGNKVNLRGSLRMMLDGHSARSRVGGTNKYNLDDEGSRIGFSFQRQINDKLNALVYYEFGNDTQSTDKKGDFYFTNRQAYGGIHYKGIGEFDFGRVTVPFNDVHQSDYSYEFGENGALYYGKKRLGRISGEGNNYLKRISNTLKYMSDSYNGFKIGASYTLQDKTDINDINYAFSTAIYYDTPANLHLRAGYTQQKSNGSTNANNSEFNNILSAKESIWGVSAKYDIPDKGLSFAVDYGGEKIGNGNEGVAHKYKPYGVSPHAKLFGVGSRWAFNEKESVYSTWAIRDGDDAANNYQETRTVLGTDYKFSKAFILWLEYSSQNNRSNRKSDKKTDDKTALGIRYYF